MFWDDIRIRWLEQTHRSCAVVCFFGQTIEYVTPKLIHFHYLKEYFLDQCKLLKKACNLDNRSTARLHIRTYSTVVLHTLTNAHCIAQEISGHTWLPGFVQCGAPALFHVPVREAHRVVPVYWCVG